mmetsp:Transcript_4311/g.11832  ORF Transcript_4311/g.11832 Transcript_4311/m.11832 type:complete len:275 (-) Transcript_4311:1-825(-)
MHGAHLLFGWRGDIGRGLLASRDPGRALRARARARAALRARARAHSGLRARERTRFLTHAMHGPGGRLAQIHGAIPGLGDQAGHVEPRCLGQIWLRRVSPGRMLVGAVQPLKVLPEAVQADEVVGADVRQVLMEGLVARVARCHGIAQQIDEVRAHQEPRIPDPLAPLGVTVRLPALDVAQHWVDVGDLQPSYVAELLGPLVLLRHQHLGPQRLLGGTRRLLRLGAQRRRLGFGRLLRRSAFCGRRHPPPPTARLSPQARNWPPPWAGAKRGAA